MIKVIVADSTSLKMTVQLEEQLKRFMIPFRTQQSKKIADYSSRCLAYAIEGYCLSKYTGLDSSEICLNYNNYGKPLLDKRYNFFYNISHCINGCILGFSNTNIGVDIENIESLDDKIVKRFYSAKEIDYTYKDKTDFYVRACEIWTRKEAYIKWDGKGLGYPITAVDVFAKSIAKYFDTYSGEKYVYSIFNIEETRDKMILETSAENILIMLESDTLFARACLKNAF